MSASYWVAKYVDDPFRNEPRNIGVIVSLNGIVAARFVGERDDGRVDERKLRAFTYPAVYLQWREFWRRKIRERDLDSIAKGTTSNFYVEPVGEVTETGGDSAAEVCHFLYGLLVGAGPLEAFDWLDAQEPGVDLAAEIADELDRSAVLATSDQLFVRHPVVKRQQIRGIHVTHTPSFSQKNGRLYVMEYIDLGMKQFNLAKDRAGWMAYMFSDIRDADDTCQAYSLVRPEGDSRNDQIDYARTLLAGESKIVNWADENERNAFISERRQIAEEPPALV
ncbi:MAG: hypothetical protein ACJ8DU_21195 [Microvirga sp.]|jgi:hypothetical protein|nr:hypothetical protein [Beijerinckiaceae bacterium]